jgi:hypothetical protein
MANRIAFPVVAKFRFDANQKTAHADPRSRIVETPSLRDRRFHTRSRDVHLKNLPELFERVLFIHADKATGARCAQTRP